MRKIKTSQLQTARDRKLLKIIEDEYTWMTQGLHDTVCQSLASIGLMADTVQRNAKTDRKYSKTKRDLQELYEGIGRAHAEMREILYILGTERFELDFFLSFQAMISSLPDGIPCSLECPTSGLRMDAYAARQINEIARAILFALIKSSGADSISVSIKQSKNEVTLSVGIEGGDSKMPKFISNYPFNWNLVQLRIKAIRGILKKGRKTIAVVIPL